MGKIDNNFRQQVLTELSFDALTGNKKVRRGIRRKSSKTMSGKSIGIEIELEPSQFANTNAEIDTDAAWQEFTQQENLPEDPREWLTEKLYKFKTYQSTADPRNKTGLGRWILPEVDPDDEYEVENFSWHRIFEELDMWLDKQNWEAYESNPKDPNVLSGEVEEYILARLYSSKWGLAQRALIKNKDRRQKLADAMKGKGDVLSPSATKIARELRGKYRTLRGKMKELIASNRMITTEQETMIYDALDQFDDVVQEWYEYYRPNGQRQEDFDEYLESYYENYINTDVNHETAVESARYEIEDRLLLKWDFDWDSSGFVEIKTDDLVYAEDQGMLFQDLRTLSEYKGSPDASAHIHVGYDGNFGGFEKYATILLADYDAMMSAANVGLDRQRNYLKKWAEDNRKILQKNIENSNERDQESDFSVDEISGYHNRSRAIAIRDGLGTLEFRMASSELLDDVNGPETLVGNIQYWIALTSIVKRRNIVRTKLGNGEVVLVRDPSSSGGGRVQFVARGQKLTQTMQNLISRFGNKTAAEVRDLISSDPEEQARQDAEQRLLKKLRATRKETLSGVKILTFSEDSARATGVNPRTEISSSASVDPDNYILFSFKGTQNKVDTAPAMTFDVMDDNRIMHHRVGLGRWSRMSWHGFYNKRSKTITMFFPAAAAGDYAKDLVLTKRQLLALRKEFVLVKHIVIFENDRLKSPKIDKSLFESTETQELLVELDYDASRSRQAKKGLMKARKSLDAKTFGIEIELDPRLFSQSFKKDDLDDLLDDPDNISLKDLERRNKNREFSFNEALKNAETFKKNFLKLDWEVVIDESDFIEFVSPILTGSHKADLLRDLNQMAIVLGTKDRTGSAHVHVGIPKKFDDIDLIFMIMGYDKRFKFQSELIGKGRESDLQKYARDNFDVIRNRTYNPRDPKPVDASAVTNRFQDKSWALSDRMETIEFRAPGAALLKSPSGAKQVLADIDYFINLMATSVNKTVMRSHVGSDFHAVAVRSARAPGGGYVQTVQRGEPLHPEMRELISKYGNKEADEIRRIKEIWPSDEPRLRSSKTSFKKFGKVIPLEFDDIKNQVKFIAGKDDPKDYVVYFYDRVNKTIDINPAVTSNAAGPIKNSIYLIPIIRGAKPISVGILDQKRRTLYLLDYGNYTFSYWPDEAIEKLSERLPISGVRRTYYLYKRRENVPMSLQEERDKPTDKDTGLPKRYVTGLSDKEKEKRAKDFERRRNLPDNHPDRRKPAPGDKNAKTKPSKATKAYHDKYGDKQEMSEEIKGLKKKSEQSGISYSILKQVYDRGMEAWESGHRPGAGQHQWAYARVNSFITGSGGSRKADADLWKKAKSQLKEQTNTLDEAFKELFND